MMIIDLDENLTITVDYDAVDDDVVINDIQITQGSVLDLLRYLEGEGFDALEGHIVEKVNDQLLLGLADYTDGEDEG